jgi:hypothetical protein
MLPYSDKSTSAGNDKGFGKELYKKKVSHINGEILPSQRVDNSGYKVWRSVVKWLDIRPRNKGSRV